MAKKQKSEKKRKKNLQQSKTSRCAAVKNKENHWILVLRGLTHETEKDKTRNVLLGMTKLRISKLGISKTEKLVWENPTLIGKYLKSNYEKTKNWEFLKWEYCHKTYTSNLWERQNWEIEIPRIPISENWIYRNDIW